LVSGWKYVEERKEAAAVKMVKKQSTGVWE
jgi:hypothetical protein